MKELTFEYKGHKFEPIGNILGGWMHKSRCTTWDRKYETKFDYDDFYKTAKKHHASCDVYKIDNSDDLYILTSGNVFLRVYNTDGLKKCEDYDVWYHSHKKYKLVYVVQGNYGYGWDDLTYEDTEAEAKNQKYTYDQNENYPHRIRTKVEEVE